MVLKNMLMKDNLVNVYIIRKTKFYEILYKKISEKYTVSSEYSNKINEYVNLFPKKYKMRTAVERDIQHIKKNLCLAGRRTQNEKTLYADLVLAGITQLITVVLADKIKHHEYLRSLKPLIA